MNEQALETLRDLCGQGFAGLDRYDDTRFLIDAPEEFLHAGEGALDDLGAYFLKTDPPGCRSSYVAALLPSAVYLALGLDSPDAPRIDVPLASRRADRGLSRIVFDVPRTPVV